MKTLKLTTVISFVFLFGIAKADKPKTHASFSMKFSITAFIDADASGNCEGLSDIIADKATFGIMNGDKIFSATKKQVLNQMESLRGVKQNCTTSYNLLENYGNYALFKVVMKYPAFSRINYITMNQCSDGWKITNITSVFSN